MGSPYGPAQIQPIWDPYMFSSDVCLHAISIQIQQDHIIKAYIFFKETKNIQYSHFVNFITIWDPREFGGQNVPYEVVTGGHL